MSSSIVCDRVTFAWADGTDVLHDLDVAFGAGRTGLIGVNGSGKSTLLRLIAGELTPGAGSISVAGEVGYLPQNLTLRAGDTVADLLGITAARAALLAIEAGDADEAHFAAVGDDWDVEERARAELDRLGLHRVGLDRTVATLSGGEAVMVGLAAQFLRTPDVLLLDEPTNNLDLDARHRLCDAVDAWPGVLLVVSHDRELLDHVDQIADLSPDGVRLYGGNLSAYQEVLAAEREAAERALRAAEADVRRQKRDLIDARTKLDRRLRYGKKMEATKREPKVIMGERKRQAQVSAGKHRTMHQEKLAEAGDRLSDAEQAVRDDDEIRVTLPRTRVPAGRTILRVTLPPVTPPDDHGTDGAGDGAPGGALKELVLTGPERVAVLGANGAGKTTLLRAIAGPTGGPTADAAGGPGGHRAAGMAVRVHTGQDGAGAVRYLPQRLDVLDDEASVLDNVRAFAPAVSPREIRAGLARFLFRGDRVGQRAGTLSGGQRFRAVLAALLLADPPPRLLLLDEPTNNLDLASVRQLTQALAAYEGALIVAGHDLPFLRDLGITRWLHLDADAGLSEIDEP